MKAQWYEVVSPPYDYTEPVLDYGQGPTYEERDVARVFTHSKRRAKVLALRAFRRYYKNRWNKPYYLCDENPFKGMEVFSIADVPKEEDDADSSLQ